MAILSLLIRSRILPIFKYMSIRFSSKAPLRGALNLMDKIGLIMPVRSPLDYDNISHARSFVVFDTLFRYLTSFGYDVKFVRPVNDVHEKIIKEAEKSEDDDPMAKARSYLESMHKVMSDLNCLPPTHEPRTSQNIDRVKKNLKKLEGKGFAGLIRADYGFRTEYGISRDEELVPGLYLKVYRFEKTRTIKGLHKGYEPSMLLWKLVQKKGEEEDDEICADEYEAKEEEEETDEICADEYWERGGRRNRRNMRGRIWAKEEEEDNVEYYVSSVFWSSAWGAGRPGPFVGTLVLAEEFLKQSSLNIHGGSDIDNLFHVFDMEQDNIANGTDQVRIACWMVVSRVAALGDDITLSKLLDAYGEYVIRYAFLKTHYGTEIELTEYELETHADSVYKMFKCLKGALAYFSKVGSVVKTEEKRLPSGLFDLHDFMRFMSGDLKTHLILQGLNQNFTKLNYLAKEKIKNGGVLNDEEEKLLMNVAMKTQEILSILGLVPSSYSEAMDTLRQKFLKICVDESKILEAIRERDPLRKANNYGVSDGIRERVELEFGVALEDGNEGAPTTWEPIIPKRLRK